MTIANACHRATAADISRLELYLVQVRAKKSVPDKKRDVGMEGFYKRQSHTYVIASTGLLSKSTSNNIGVRLTFIEPLHSYVPLFIWYRFFGPHLFALFFDMQSQPGAVYHNVIFCVLFQRTLNYI